MTPPPADPTRAVPSELLALSQYSDVRLLGSGGMGSVYLAKNVLMDRFEVLKVIGRELLDRPDLVERFLREIRAAARLSHPNVVTAYSALPAGSLLVFAMEYVPGANLDEVVRVGGPLPVPVACEYVCQAAAGLQHAHERGMVHRDIKPANLVLQQNGPRIVKILDFGLAKATSEKRDAGLTATGQVFGTPDYMAPEQTEDAGKADIRADVYALGCTLFYLLTGQAPFKANSLFSLMLAHREATPPRLADYRPDMPVGLQDVLDRLLAKSPAARYQTPGEVSKVLKGYTKGLPGSVSSSSKKVPPQTTPTSQFARQSDVQGVGRGKLDDVVQAEVYNRQYSNESSIDLQSIGDFNVEPVSPSNSSLSSAELIGRGQNDKSFYTLGLPNWMHKNNMHYLMAIAVIHIVAFLLLLVTGAKDSGVIGVVIVGSLCWIDVFLFCIWFVLLVRSIFIKVKM